VRPGRVADHSPPSSAAVMEEYSCTSTHRLGHTGPEMGKLYFFSQNYVFKMAVTYSVVQHEHFKDDLKFSNYKVRLVQLVLKGKSLSYLELFIFFHYGLRWQKEKFSKYSLEVILHMMRWLGYLFHSCCLIVKTTLLLTLVCQ